MANNYSAPAYPPYSQYQPQGVQSQNFFQYPLGTGDSRIPQNPDILARTDAARTMPYSPVVPDEGDMPDDPGLRSWGSNASLQSLGPGDLIEHEDFGDQGKVGRAYEPLDIFSSRQPATLLPPIRGSF